MSEPPKPEWQQQHGISSLRNVNILPNNQMQDYQDLHPNILNLHLFLNKLNPGLGLVGLDLGSKGRKLLPRGDITFPGLLRLYLVSFICLELNQADY